MKKELKEIPEKWCVRRTPENAEVLNACYGGGGNHGWVDNSGLHHRDMPACPEITYEKWQTIPEVKDFLITNWLCNSKLEPVNKRLERMLSEGPDLREIIGYDWTKGLSEEKKTAANRIQQLGYHGVNFLFIVDSYAYKLFKELELMHWFEPVYKEAPKPQFKVGDWVAARYNGVKELYIGKVSEIDPRILLNPYYLNGPDNEGVFNEGLFHEIIRLATPEEIEKATFKPVWERFPTWESLGHDTHVHEGKIKVAANSLLKLSQIEKAWNEGKKGSWTVSLVNGRLATRQTLTYSAQINFASETLAEKSLELHGDLWRKFWMV